jgi:hypothetical protein
MFIKGHSMIFPCHVNIYAAKVGNSGVRSWIATGRKGLMPSELSINLVSMSPFLGSIFKRTQRSLWFNEKLDP